MLFNGMPIGFPDLVKLIFHCWLLRCLNRTILLKKPLSFIISSTPITRLFLPVNLAAMFVSHCGERSDCIVTVKTRWYYFDYLLQSVSAYFVLRKKVSLIIT